MQKIKSNVKLPTSHVGCRLHATIFKEKETRVNTPTKGLIANLKDMKTGDCVKFKCSEYDRVKIVQHRISAVAIQYCNKLGIEYKETFTTRVTKNGVAIFCIGQ